MRQAAPFLVLAPALLLLGEEVSRHQSVALERVCAMRVQPSVFSPVPMQKTAKLKVGERPTATGPAHRGVLCSRECEWRCRSMNLDRKRVGIIGSGLTRRLSLPRVGGLQLVARQSVRLAEEELHMLQQPLARRRQPRAVVHLAHELHSTPARRAREAHRVQALQGGGLVP